MGETDDLMLAKEGEGQEEGSEETDRSQSTYVIHIHLEGHLNDLLPPNRPHLLAVYWTIN